MTDAGTMRMAGASDIRARAAQWAAERASSDQWNAEKQAMLEAWLAESTAHEIAYVRMESTWNRTERLAALRLTNTDIAAPPSARRKTIFIWSAGAMVAAVAVLLAVGAAFVLRGADKRTYQTAIGGHRVLTLADGSRIELNTDTVLQVAVNDERKIWLRKGEAYFQVIHSAQHPFVVTVGDRRITDLGTKFVVRQDVDRLSVAVVEGRVGLAAKADGAQPLLLNAGDGVVSTAESLSVTRKPARELANELGWRRGLLIFRHTAMADAAAEFNRYNRDRIVVADSAVAHLTIDGTFPENDMGAFVEVAQAVFGLRVERRNGETLISR